MTHALRLERLERRLEDAGELLEAHSTGRGVDLRRYRGRSVVKIAAFAKTLCKLEPTEQQRQIFALYVTGRWAAIRSAVGIGKTTAVAVLLLYHAYVERGKVVSLSATDRQVKELLWSEVRRLWVGSGLSGELYQQALVIGGQTRAIGFVTTAPDKLRGWHHERLLVLVDESQGVPPWVWEELPALAIGERNQVLAIGNPGPPVGPWYNVFQNPAWAHLVLSSIDHVNIREGRELIPGGPSLAHIERIRREFGEGSSTYRALILGEFAESLGEGLIERAWIDAAVERWQSGALEEEAQRGALRAAIDVARFGPDSNALILQQGPVIRQIETWRRCDLVETVDRLVATLVKWSVRIWPYPNWEKSELALNQHGNLAFAQLIVDSIGLGAGVHDICKRRGFHVAEFISSHAVQPTESHKFLNRRAEAAFGLMRRFQDGTIVIPPDERLIEELLAIRWLENASGRIQIEGKDETRLMLGRSPDLFDALCMVADESHQGATIRQVRVRW